MRTFKQYLSEGLSPILYHSTSVQSVTSMLRSDTFRLSTDIGTSADRNEVDKGRYYFFSMTRHKLGNFTSDGAGWAVLVLDGKKLGHNYKGKPIDYWGPDFAAVDRSKQEAEDRIFHNEPTIPHASKYIKEIHISLDQAWRNEGEYEYTDLNVSTRIRDLWKQALKKKIPIFFYRDKKAFMLQNKKKTVKLDLKKMPHKTEPSEKWPKFKSSPKFDHFLELYHTPILKYKQLSRKASNVVRDLYYLDSMSGTSVIRQFANVIHGERKSSEVTPIVKIFQKEKIRTPKDFLELLRKKWKRPYELSKF